MFSVRYALTDSLFSVRYALRPKKQFIVEHNAITAPTDGSTVIDEINPPFAALIKKQQMTEVMKSRANILWYIAMVSTRVLCEIWAEGDEELVIIETDFSRTTKVTQELQFVSDVRD